MYELIMKAPPMVIRGMTLASEGPWNLTSNSFRISAGGLKECLLKEWVSQRWDTCILGISYVEEEFSILAYLSGPGYVILS